MTIPTGPPLGPPDPPSTPTVVAAVAARPPTHKALDDLWADPPGWRGQLTGVQNDKIGLRLLLTGFFFLILGGSVDSIVMRLQLALPGNDLVGPQLYNELFTNHGSVTMFLVILPIFEGFAILLLPLLLGSREMPFPRLGAFSYWTFLLGGLLYYSSTLFQLVPDAGWFAYTPLSGPNFSPDLALDFWVLGLGVAEVGAIAAGFEIIIGVLKMRAPGMTLTRMPLFAWAVLVMAFMILFAFTPLIIGSLLLELDRGFGTQFFNPEQGGSSLLWQHLFWIFGHPEVYIQFIPATGVVSMIIPTFTRQRMVGYLWLVAALVAVGLLSFGLWAHHMFAVGLPPLVLGFFAASSMAIGVPAGIQIFAWLATIWSGRVVWRTPFLFVIGFLIIFVIGGITGVMLAAPPFDLQAHDSHFVVAHLHYVLIGGVAFPIFAGVYYWFPKFTGRMLGERLGRWNFWLLFIGVNVTFFPMHIVGLLGMPRRIYTYDESTGWGIYNLVSTVGALVSAAGIAVFVLNVVRSFRRGAPAGANPWGGDSLEWAVSSPPAEHGWSVLPIVTSRHPLWDQEDLQSGDEHAMRFVQAFGRWPLRWRAALVVGTADGRPQEVFRVSSPSIWPLVTALGVVTIFVSELAKVRLGLGLGAAVVVGAVIAWNRPSPPAMSEEEEAAFEAEHGVPVNAGGSVVIGTWAMSLAVLFVTIAFASLLLSYFYLRLENPQWPPPGVESPDPVLPLVAGASLVAAAVAMRRGLSALRGGEKVRYLVSLGVAIAGTAAAVATQFLALHSMDLAATAHAYGSIFYTLGGFVLVVTSGALIMGALVMWWSWQGHYNARRHVAVANVVRFHLAMTAVWIVGFGTLYLAPGLM